MTTSTVNRTPIRYADDQPAPQAYTVPLGKFARERYNRPAPGEVVTTSRVQWADAEVPISPAQKWNQATLPGKRVRPPASPHAEALRLRKAAQDACAHHWQVHGTSAEGRPRFRCPACKLTETR